MLDSGSKGVKCKLCTLVQNGAKRLLGSCPKWGEKVARFLPKMG